MKKKTRSKVRVGLGQWLTNVVIWLTMSLNILTGGRPGQTFSARVHLQEGKFWRLVEILIDVLFYVLANERNHCLNATIYPPVLRSVSDAIAIRAASL